MPSVLIECSCTDSAIRMNRNRAKEFFGLFWAIDRFDALFAEHEGGLALDEFPDRLEACLSRFGLLRTAAAYLAR